MPFSWMHDGVRFRYRDEGAGVPFVFQHGLAGTCDAPLELFPPPAGVREICLECRAHGETAPVGAAVKISFRSFADDIVALLDHLGLESVILGGTSMGAAVSLNLATRYPQRVRALVLSRPAWLDAPMPVQGVLLRLAELIQACPPEEGVRRFRASREYLELAALSPYAAENLAVEFQWPRAKECAVRFERIPIDAPGRDRNEWKYITVPTLVLATRHDPVHPYEFGEVLASLIPRAELREITAKSVSLEQHEREVRSALGEFLGRVGA